MSRRMWKVVEVKAGKVRMAEVKGGGKKVRKRKEVRRGRKEEKAKAKKEENGGIGDIEQSSKVRERSKKVGSRKIP